MKYLIDPGHGGETAPGAVGPAGAQEKDIALAVSLMIAGHLSCNDYDQVRLTRYTDHELSLDDRCEISNAGDYDCFVSIHCNAAEASSATGFEVWTSPGWTLADPIATTIWRSFKEAFPDMRARLDTSDGDPDKESRFRVLVGTHAPAVLVELGFISNPEQEQRLLSPVFQTRAAGAISEAVRGALHG